MSSTPLLDGEIAAGSGVRSTKVVTISVVVGALVVLLCLCIGLQPIADNSFLTHLATGRLMRADGIVRSDPYSFTAPGRHWVVQSWLASATYAGLDHLGGARALVAFTAAVSAALGALLWYLSRHADAVVGRLLLIVPAVAVAGNWSERPLLLGLLGLAGLLALADSTRPAWWAVPVMWCWANVHGSFPLGLVVLGLIALGERADGTDAARTVTVLKGAAIGTALAVVNPYGVGLLTFPVQLLGRSDSLRYIVEWRAPSFTTWPERAFLIQIATVALLATRRSSWRLTLPAIPLVLAALTSSRNIAVASIVIVAVTARSAAGLGTIAGDQPIRRGRLLLAGFVALGALVTGSSMGGQVVNTRAYPAAALAWLEGSQGLGGRSRLIAPDVVGNFIEAAYGPAVPVFIDDRVEVYPDEVMDDAMTLLNGEPGWRDVLGRYGATAVLWRSDAPLTSALLEADGWRVVYADPYWIVVLPDG